ncbi:hypothetical protein OPT61_g3545 [Boeremia exigua]|uniref:Uncharacterized protein n=1 Tax=Boeremia exigua TaxID=749465 RepID=A0ACC2IHK8_9PLEO|nr:hypothetical protein OPT61_g3545 [Boeremia exigua]
MDEIFVAVMGATGSGKSSFIQQVTGDQKCRVGHTLESETTEVREYRCQYSGRAYVLIDTPGFDDSYRSNSEVVDAILAWLEQSYRSKNLLSGIIYLHRINSVRMQGNSLQNLRMFRKLCGNDVFKNVLLVTTFWDTVNEAEGRAREEELSSNDEFWGMMIQKGSRMRRWSSGSHLDITKGILASAVPENKRALRAQIEIVDQGRSRDEIKIADFQQMLFTLNADFEREKAQMQGQLAQKQQAARSQVKEERSRMRAAATKEIQIENDARFAAELMEAERVELQNATERHRLQQQIARKEEETRQAKLKFQEENNKKETLKRYYENHQCTHAEAEKGQTCDKCSKDLLKKQTHHFHCCHCGTLGYNQCADCGFACLAPEHPRMVFRPGVRDPSCNVM